MAVFWLDAGRAHDIEDVFGFLRVEPFGVEPNVLALFEAPGSGGGF